MRSSGDEQLHASREQLAFSFFFLSAPARMHSGNCSPPPAWLICSWTILQTKKHCRWSKSAKIINKYTVHYKIAEIFFLMWQNIYCFVNMNIWHNKNHPHSRRLILATPVCMVVQFICMVVPSTLAWSFPSNRVYMAFISTTCPCNCVTPFCSCF